MLTGAMVSRVATLRALSVGGYPKSKHDHNKRPPRNLEHAIPLIKVAKDS